MGQIHSNLQNTLSNSFTISAIQTQTVLATANIASLVALIPTGTNVTTITATVAKSIVAQAAICLGDATSINNTAVRSFYNIIGYSQSNVIIPFYNYSSYPLVFNNLSNVQITLANLFLLEGSLTTALGYLVPYMAAANNVVNRAIALQNATGSVAIKTAKNNLSTAVTGLSTALGKLTATAANATGNIKTIKTQADTFNKSFISLANL